MVKERVLAVPDTSIFTAELPEATRNVVPERFRRTRKRTSLPAGMGSGK